MRPFRDLGLPERAGILARSSASRQAAQRRAVEPECNAMSKLRVHSFSISIDGYGAGPHQDLQNPLGVGGPELFDWFFHTRTWQRMHGNEDGETGVDDDIAAQGFAGIGA
jgi:hypothetical protein